MVAKTEELKLRIFPVLEKLNILEKNFKIAVATSGGSDSLALALLLNDWANSKGGRLYSVTIDHGIRLESSEEASKTKKWLEKREIEHETIRLNLGEEKNISKNARDERYKYLIDFCQKRGIYELFLGHNLGDQAENFLIRSIRGSGVQGLSAMKYINYLENVRVIRPFLGVKKHEIKDFLTETGQEWIEDPTNKDESFLRVKTRNFFEAQEFAEPELLKKRFSDNSIKLLEAEKCLYNQVLDFIYFHVKISSDNVFSVNRKEFLFLDKYISVKFLKEIIEILGKKEYGARIKAIEKIYVFLQNESSKGRILVNNCEIRIKTRNIFSISTIKAI